LETQITKVLFITIKQVYTWWEWFPAGEVKISNLPVSAGDVMYCLICADTMSHATVYFTKPVPRCRHPLQDHPAVENTVDRQRGRMDRGAPDHQWLRCEFDGLRCVL